MYTLVIAACGKELIGVFTADFKTMPRGARRRYFAPKRTVISGKEFQIKVQLIGKRQGDVRLNKVFDFKLTLEPEPKIEEIKPDELLAPAPSENRAKREYIIKRLQELISLHSQLPTGWVDSGDPRFGMWGAFSRDSQRFLAQYFDEAHVERFKKEGVIVLEKLLLEYLK
jgi:hypothetical protein